MKRHGIGIALSLIIHIALVLAAYTVFANDKIIKEKTPPPKTLPLKLSMFEPPVDPAPDVVKEIITPVKPAIQRQVQKPKTKKQSPKKKQKKKKQTKHKPKKVKPKKTAPKSTIPAQLIAQVKALEPVKQVAVAKPKPITKPVAKPRPAPIVNQQMINAFKASVKRAIDSNKRYPMSARRRNQQGSVIISFTLMRNGSVQRTRVSRSSGFKKLDQAALKAVKGISRKLPIPNQINKASWDFSVPIQFGLQ